MPDLDEVLAALKQGAMAEPAPSDVEPIKVELYLNGGLSFDNTHLMVQFTKDCVSCKGWTTVIVLEAKYKQWRAGTHIQNVWPDASAGDREVLISGTHSVCFDRMFPPDDERDDPDIQQEIPRDLGDTYHFNDADNMGDERLGPDGSL